MTTSTAHIETAETPPINADFLGGPRECFEELGREQLRVLLDHGLESKSRVMDIGCGCLRGGRWIIPLLEPGHYCGVEPMEHMVQKGLEQFVPADIVRIKQPRFDHNDQFDFSSFGETFSHFIARSIWTHASKRQIEQMLDGVNQFGTPDCTFLTSFRPAKAFGRKDYKGDDWVGKSHKSSEGGLVRHSFSWIRDACARRGLRAFRLNRPPVNEQPWIVIQRA